jgi:hypothetical protein
VTRGELKAAALALIDSDVNDPFFSGTIDSLADMANRDVFSLLVEVAPDMFETITPVTYPADAEYLSNGEGAYRMLSVGMTPANADVAPSNLLVPLRPCTIGDRMNKLQLTPAIHGYYYVWAYTRLYVAPIPAQDLYLKLRAVPILAAMTGDNDKPLMGTAYPFHDAVAVRLAALLNSKQDSVNKMVGGLWQEAKANLQAQAPQRIAEPKFVRLR